MPFIYDVPEGYFEGTINFSVVVDQKWWGVPEVGIMKSVTNMTVKLSLEGMRVSVKITETDVMTDYGG